MAVDPNDYIGSRHLTVNSGPIATNTGVVAQAADIVRASSQFLSHAAHTDFKPSTNSWQATGYFYATNSALTQCVLSITDGGSAASLFSYYLLGGYMYGVHYYNGGSYIELFGAMAVSSTTWYAFDIGNNLTDLYSTITEVDTPANTETVTTTWSGKTANTVNTPFRIGRDQSGSNYWGGRIDDVRWYVNGANTNYYPLDAAASATRSRLALLGAG